MVKYFGISLGSVQYYHNKLLYEMDWEDDTLVWKNFYNENIALTLLKYCVISSSISSSISVFNYDLHKIEGYSFTRQNQIIGYGRKVDDFIVLSLISTSNISDVLFSLNNDLVDIDDGQIHRGYYVHTMEFLSSILMFMNKYSGIRKLYITGHSLGGALSSVLGYILNKNFGFEVIVYTYGSPKFGNKQLKHFIENMKGIKIYNVINSADVVTNKPTNWKYVRIGNEIKNRCDTGNDNVNHGIKVYRDVVKNRKSNVPKRKHRFDEILQRFFLDILG